MKNSIFTTFLLTLSIICMPNPLRSANHVIFKDMSENIISNQATYTEITAQNNPGLYKSFQDFNKTLSNNEPTKVCTIPGSMRWGTLADTNTKQTYVVCPCNKTAFNIEDIMYLYILTNAENLECLITSKQILEKKLLFTDETGKTFNIFNIPLFKNFLDWIEEIKKKHPTIDFDNMSWVISKQDWGVSYKKFPNEIIMYCPLSSVLKGMISADEAILLHEMGHVENHKKYPFLRHANSFAIRNNKKLFIAGIAALYTSSITINCMLANNKLSLVDYYKYNSVIAKVALAILGAHTIHMVGGNIDERMADNFACKHSDKKTLIGWKNYFVDSSLKETQNIKKDTDTLPYGLKTLGNYLALGLRKIAYLTFDEHPLTESRIAKIEKSIATK